jgi:hypothetical protein
MVQTISDRNSANGIASHIPLTPNNNGNTHSPVNTKTNVLSSEMKADTFPFERAVNNMEVKILIPINKKPIENIRKPSMAM